MAARNRQRNGQVKDDQDEERNLWNQIITQVKQLQKVHVRATEISRLITSAEKEMSIDEAPSISKLDELEKLYREGVKLSEEEQKVLKEEPDDLIKNTGILVALRTASETEPPQLNISKARNPKRKLEDSATDSSAPSPVMSSSATRLVKSAVSRSGSVPAVREVSVKIEEGAGDAQKSSAERQGKLNLAVGAEVFYRNKAKAAEGEGILCNVTNVIGEGKQRRYEIQDADPEPDESGNIPPPYRASVSALIPIPSNNAGLPDFPKNKQVLALYPQTTTFYRAEVMGTRKDKKNFYVLKFEGEEEQGKEQDVERRYVLDALK